MNSTEIKEKMKALHGEMAKLESKLEAADEGKREIIKEMIEGKTTEWDTLKTQLAHVEKREQIAKEIQEMDAKRNETEGKTANLKDVVVEDTKHNQNREAIEHTNFFNQYITYGGKVSDMVHKVANEKGALYVESKMAGSGAKMPDWMGKAIMPQPNSAEIEAQLMQAAYEGKAAVAVKDNSGTLSGGGSLVPELFDTMLFKIPKRQAGIVDRCYVKRGVGKEMQFPKLTQSSNEYGIAVSLGTEGAALASSDPVFSRIDVNLTRLGAYSQATLREIRENKVGLEAEMVWMYQGAINRAIDALILNGSGVAGAPQGINTNAGITAGVAPVARETLNQISYADLVNMQFAVDDGVFGTGTYVLSAGSTGAMKYIASLDDSAGRPIFAGDSNSGWGVGAGSVPTIAGQPYIATVSNKDFDSGTVKALGARGDVIYGNFMGYGFCWDSASGVSIERSDDFAFTSGLVTFRCIVYIGGKILGGQMFSVLDDVSTASSSSSSSSS